nr:hypothetical protein [Tanacetum cinerariifolium]
MIVESIYIRFDEIKEVSETSIANDTSGLVPQRQKASDYDNPDSVPQRQDVSSSADEHHHQLIQMCMLRKTMIKQKKENNCKMTNLPILYVHRHKNKLSLPHITLFAPIIGYGDLVQGNVTINKVYYVECLNHNLFSVGQFCDADLEVAFRKSTLSHLNFDYINLLSKKDIVIGLPKLKYVKDQQCSSCELSKIKRSSFKSKAVSSLKGRLNLLHMDLCGPMRVASINGKKYILVNVDDYLRYTWTLFLRFKDETPEVLKDFLMMIQRNLQALVITVRTDRGT